MERERGNFRGRVFGFDRQDVIDYIEELAAQRNLLQQENQELRERMWEYENGESGAPETAPAPAAPEPESDAKEEARAALESAVAEARELLKSVRQEYDSLCADVKINASHAEGELRTVAERLSGIQSALGSAGERLEAIGRKLEETEG